MAIIHTGPIAEAMQFSETDVTGVTAGPVIFAGSSSAKIATSTASTKFVQMYFDSSATADGSDTRGIYVRLYHSGATTGGGEALRAYTTINGAAVGTAHGAHISLDFVSSSNSGRLSGLGVAGRNTLHIPDDADWTSGTLAAVQAEIYSDGDDSDPDGVTELSFIRIVNDGNANGKADVDDDAVAFSFQGFDEASGGMIYDNTGADPTNSDGSIKIKIGSQIRYLMYYDQQAA